MSFFTDLESWGGGWPCHVSDALPVFKGFMLHFETIDFTKASALKLWRLYFQICTGIFLLIYVVVFSYFMYMSLADEVKILVQFPPTFFVSGYGETDVIVFYENCVMYIDTV